MLTDGRKPKSVKTELPGGCFSESSRCTQRRSTPSGSSQARQSSTAPCSATCGDKCRKFAYRFLSDTAAPHRPAPAAGNRAGGQAIEGSRAGSLPPVCAPSCCSGRRSPAPRQYHGRTPPSCPPRIRHTLFHETDTGSALRLPAFIEWLYFTQQFSVLFPSFSVATFRRRSSCAALALPAPGTDRVRFCAALLSRPQSPTTSLAPPFSARLKRNRMVDDGHR